MNKRSLATLISGATLLASAAGCNNPKGVANANDSNAADTAAAANVSNAPATAAVSPTPMQPTANSNLGTVVATVPAPDNAPAAASGTAAKNGGRGARSAKVPLPQVGSGGNDLFLFTQVRGSINSDGALKNSGIVVDVKDGNVVLSGSVADESQRSKAEQIAKSVGGVKSVRNSLRVAKGGATK
ncbi:MAG: BON domain-containing protein [Pyrinomonadaceae bacterium]